MSAEKWSYLKSLPYGLIIFGKSSDPHISLPEQIADGDLDGDLYHALWDINMIELLKTAEPVIAAEEQCSDEHYECKYDKDKYDFGDGHDVENKSEVIAILGHEGRTGQTLKVKWRLHDGSNIVTNKSKKELKEEIPDMISQYAIDNGLLETKGFMWCKKLARDNIMKGVVSHEVQNNIYTFEVKCDNGDSVMRTADELKIEEPALLHKYALTANILHDWCNEYESTRIANWFDNCQEDNAKLKLLKDEVRLKQVFHRLYESSMESGDMEAAESYANAHKKAIDFKKHNGEINLLPRLIENVKDLQNYISNI